MRASTAVRYYLFISLISSNSAQFYEDKRCKCVCPSPSAVLDTSGSTERKLFIANVAPSKCNCDGVILPNIGAVINGREEAYCLRCECKYEIRNTGVIKFVVILVVLVTMMLIIYMGFLMCLDPLLKRKRHKIHRETRQGLDEARNLLAYEDD